MVQADFLNGLIDDTILVKITGKQFGIPGTEVELDPGNEPVSGLSKLCYASATTYLRGIKCWSGQSSGLFRMPPCGRSRIA